MVCVNIEHEDVPLPCLKEPVVVGCEKTEGKPCRYYCSLIAAGLTMYWFGAFMTVVTQVKAANLAAAAAAGVGLMMCFEATVCMWLKLRAENEDGKYMVAVKGTAMLGVLMVVPYILTRVMFPNHRNDGDDVIVNWTAPENVAFRFASLGLAFVCFTGLTLTCVPITERLIGRFFPTPDRV
eukprot:TRINITY_DN25520_c0_g1_i1.p1 TRINITY_DN25520_c0_g1~~TRINITY_DN25520_c0_g1_i1.p1  ORF type:complete len:193 (+),score=35.52 TRINITY_DN25520_c0_g1_i1:39-581(+)